MPQNPYDAFAQGPAPELTEYDRLLNDQSQQAQTAMRASMREATKTQPDTRAKVLRWSQQYGVPADAIERTFKEYETRTTLESTPYDLMLSETPGLATWLQNPDNAAVSRDDLPQLGTIEKITSKIGNLWSAVKGGAYGAAMGLAGFVEGQREEAAANVRFRSDVPEIERERAIDRRRESMVSPVMALRQYFQRKQQAETASRGENLGLFERGLYSGIESLTQVATTLPLSVLSRSAAPTLIAMGTQTAGQSFAQARDAGKSVDDALRYGTIDGLIEAGTEAVPAFWLIDDVVKHTGLWRTLRRQLLAEMPGEQVATVLQDLNEWATLNPDKPFADYLRERPSAAAETAIATIVAVGGTTGVARAIERGVSGKPPAQAVLDELGAAVGASATYGRMPEKVAEFLADATKDTPAETVYLPVESFRTYFQQQGLDPAAIAEALTGNRDALAEAAVTGADLAVPLARYATVLAPEHGQFFNQEARFDPAEMNAREAAAFAEAQAQAVEVRDAEVASAQPTQPVRDALLAQLEAAGLERSTAETEVTRFMAVAQTTAERFGIEVPELAERFPLRVLEGTQEEGSQGEAALMQRAPETEAFRQWFGDSKAVDESGEPLVMYHGTFMPEGFASGVVNGPAYFTPDADYASAFAAPEQGGEDGAHSTIVPTFLRIRNPLDLRGLGLDTIDAAPFIEALSERGVTLPTELREVVEGLEYETAWGYVRRLSDVGFGSLLKRAGFDGVIQREETLDGTGRRREADAYLVFDSSQVKSAIGNRGTFDPNDSSILKQGESAFIRFDKDGKAEIGFFKARNLSSFSHEAFHYWLNVHDTLTADLALRDPASLTDTQRQMLADRATIRRELGAEPDGAFTTEQHERWARLGEEYLREGKAPSAELRPVFARIRAWLVGIYGNLKRVVGLDRDLNDEIRQVMDRLHATDEAIAAAEAEGQVAPLFTDAARAGMTPEQFAAYRHTVQTASDKARDALQTRVMREYTREREAWWKTERAKVRETVAAEVYAEPVYRALAGIQKGTNPDGTSLVEGQDPVPMKLSKAALVAQYAPDFLKALPKPYVYTVDGGLAPDAVAEAFGFSSGDELLKAIVAAEPLRAKIDRLTDATMQERHGNLLLDGTIAEAADEAVQGQREAVIRAELKALTAGMQKAVIPPARVLNAMAQEQVARAKVRTLQPGRYLMAAQRAAKRAFDTVESDRLGAVQAKQQELLNYALYRAARDAKAEADSADRYMKSFSKPATRARIGKAGQSYLDQIDGVLDRYEFASVSQTTLDRRASLRKWVAALEGEGLPVDLPESVLEDSRRVNWQELTVEELRGVRDAVKQIAHLARLKSKLLRAAEKREFDEVATGLDASLRAHTPTRPRTIETRLPTDAAARAVEGFFGAHRKLSSLVREMDGFEDGGAMWEAILRPVNEAADTEAARNADATRALATIFETAYPGRETARLYDKQHIPAINGSLSKMGRLMVALNWGNEGNRQRILSGYNWTEAQVAAILDTLDRRDWTFVEGVWSFIDQYWPDIKAKQERVVGVAPEKVEASPFQTKFGEVRGGYFPLKYDDRQSATAAQHLDVDLAGLQKYAAYTQATTRRGHTEARVDNVTLPVRLDFGVIFEHTQQVIHDLTHHEMLIDVGRLLADKRVQSAIYDTQGDQVYKQVKAALRDIAFGDVPATTGLERAVNHVRQGATIAGLGWNLSTTLLQPLGLTQSMVRIGPKWVGIGLARWLRSPKTFTSTPAWINERSTFMRTRALTQQREINEIRNHVGLNTGRFSGWVDEALRTTTANTATRQGIVDSFFWTIQQAQRIADIPTWLGAYEKALAADPDEARAVALADQAVLDSQGGGQLKDLASVQRGGPLLRLWTNFYSFFNVTYNLSVESAKRTHFRNPAEVGRLAADYLMLYIVPATLGFGLKEALRGGDDDDEQLFERLVRENLSYLTGTLIGLREISGAVQGYAGYEGPAGARVFSSASRLVKQAEQGELDEAALKALNDTAGVLLHYPAGQVRRSIDGYAAMREGKTENPAALLVGPPRE